MTRLHQNISFWSLPIFAIGFGFICFSSNSCHAQSGAKQDPADNIKLRAANEQSVGQGFEQERIKSIDGRIKLLKSILADERNRKQNEVKPASPTPPDKESILPASPRMHETPEMSETPEMHEMSEMHEKPEVLKTQEPAQQALIESDIATRAIDSFELGYSLFMTGNFKAASNNFLALLEERQTPAETAWLQCLVGCCDRLQQDFDDAETRFRSTVDEKLAPEVTARHADWNLQYIAQRKQSIDAMKQISMQLEQILKEIESDN